MVRAQTFALCQALALSLLVHSSESMTSHPVWARRLESLPIKTNPSCGVAHCSRCSTKVVSGVFEEDDVEKSVSVAKLPPISFVRNLPSHPHASAFNSGDART